MDFFRNIINIFSSHSRQNTSNEGDIHYWNGTEDNYYSGFYNINSNNVHPNISSNNTSSNTYNNTDRGYKKCNLPVIVIGRYEIEKQENCPICMGENKIKQLQKLLPCNHFFHQKCIKDWFKIKKECPVCRNSDFSSTKIKHSLQKYYKIKKKFNMNYLKNKKLKDLSVCEIKFLLKELNVDYSTAIEKKDLIELLIRKDPDYGCRITN
tara:strand:- start:441 stop:1067 length:627 start_codon:yes stop_codon:yes gene_type:complete